MSDLLAFLLARIAEDEEWMREAQRQGDFGASIPERILAECEAKRRIVERYVDTFRNVYGDDYDAGAGHRHLWVLREMAEVYADHPDYTIKARTGEWKP